MDQLFQLRRAGRLRGDDAVAIEGRLRQQRLTARHLLQREGVRLRLPEVSEDAAGQILQSARPGIPGEGLQRQPGRTVQQRGRISEAVAGPLHAGEQLGNPDAPVLVGVQQRERARVEAHALHRADQDRPEFLGQFGETREVLAAVQPHLPQAAGLKEAPAMTSPEGAGKGQADSRKGNRHGVAVSRGCADAPPARPSPPASRRRRVPRPWRAPPGAG